MTRSKSSIARFRLIRINAKTQRVFALNEELTELQDRPGAPVPLGPAFERALRQQ
jgi:hypothetical protein